MACLERTVNESVRQKLYGDASVLVPECRFDTWTMTKHPHSPEQRPHKPLGAPCHEATSSRYLLFVFFNLTLEGLREGLLVPRGGGQQPRRSVTAVNLRPLQRQHNHPGCSGTHCAPTFPAACGGDDYN